MRYACIVCIAQSIERSSIDIEIINLVSERTRDVTPNAISNSNNNNNKNDVQMVYTLYCTNIHNNGNKTTTNRGQRFRDLHLGIAYIANINAQHMLCCIRCLTLYSLRKYKNLLQINTGTHTHTPSHFNDFIARLFIFISCDRRRIAMFALSTVVVSVRTCIGHWFLQRAR